MAKTAKKEMTAKEVASKLGVTEAEALEIIKADKKQREKEALVIAKHGKGSGRVNRQTGEVEEIDFVLGSFSYRENTSGKGGKWGMKIRCFDDPTQIRWVATSDLHQVARCEANQKEHKAALRKASRKTGTKVDPKQVEALRNIS